MYNRKNFVRLKQEPQIPEQTKYNKTKQGPLAIFVVFLGVIVDKYKDVPPLYVTLFDDTSSIMFPMKPLNQKDDENKREIFVIRNGCKNMICFGNGTI